MDGMKGGKHNSDDTEGTFTPIKIKRENLGPHLFDKQLDMIGKKRTDIVDSYMWRFDFTMSSEQLDEFTKYSIALIKKTLRVNKKKATEIFTWFLTNFGVRIKD